VGAVTWGNGTTGITGAVSSANSLVGHTAGDMVGEFKAALTNGNFVVSSPSWQNGSVPVAGAATWMDGQSGLIGEVSTANSLVGTTQGDDVGNVIPLVGGNYVVAIPDWNNGAAYTAGALVWGNGRSGITGAVSSTNALVGTQAMQHLGQAVTVAANGNYVVTSAHAVTLGRGNMPLIGTVNSGNSVVETDVRHGGFTFDYDALRDRLVVGWPASNVVTIFQLDVLLASGFD